MVTNVVVFNNPEFGEVRTVAIDGEPWFVGKDVALILGYTNPQKALRDHVDDEDKTLNESFTVNGTKGVLINESGLYNLIIRSQMPKACQFKRWITGEVLPALRRTGTYTMPGAEQQPVVVASDKLIRCAEIMAGCLEGNRPYVLNILQHIVPTLSEEKTTEKVEIGATKKPTTKNSLPSPVDIDIVKLVTEMALQGLTLEALAERSRVSANAISCWIRGKHKPALQNRTNVCKALGKDEDFLTPKRKKER